MPSNESTSQADIEALDRAGFAWEFLRRNEAYRRDFSQIAKDGPMSEQQAISVGERWGLCFRL